MADSETVDLELDEEGFVPGLGSDWAEAAWECFDDFDAEIEPDNLESAAELFLDAYERSKGVPFENIASPLEFYSAVHPGFALQQVFDMDGFSFLPEDKQAVLREAMEWATRWQDWEEEQGEES